MTWAVVSALIWSVAKASILVVLSDSIWAVVSAARSAVSEIKAATCSVDIWAMSLASIALTCADVRPAICVGGQGLGLIAGQRSDLGGGQGSDLVCGQGIDVGGAQDSDLGRRERGEVGGSP